MIKLITLIFLFICPIVSFGQPREKLAELIMKYIEENQDSYERCFTGFVNVVFYEGDSDTLIIISMESFIGQDYFLFEDKYGISNNNSELNLQYWGFFHNWFITILDSKNKMGFQLYKSNIQNFDRITMYNNWDGLEESELIFGVFPPAYLYRLKNGDFEFIEKTEAIHTK